MTNNKTNRKSTLLEGLFLLIMIFSVMDMHLMVYPSLSRSLLTGMLISLSGCVFLWKAKKNGSLTFDIIQLYLIAWIIYIIVYSSLVPSDLYRVFYLVCSLTLGVIMASMLRSQMVRENILQNTLLIIAAIQILTVLLQLVGAIEHSGMYGVTGLYENPTPTALFLTGCCPIVLNRILTADRCKGYVTFLLFLILCILLLRCRTAWLGLIVITCFYLNQIMRRFTGLSHFKWDVRHFLAIFPIIIILVSCLYFFKRGSSEGRLFIWKNTAEMISSRPMGYGYGLFERNYNIWQAKYFSLGTATKREQLNADVTFMPYNDILEQCVEGGVPGGILYLGIYLIPGIIAWKRKDRLTLSVIVSFLVMSLVNFVYTSDSGWLLFVITASVLSSHEGNAVIFKDVKGKAVLTLGFLLMLIICVRELKVAKAQILLSSYRDIIYSGSIINDRQIEELADDIETSEVYHTLLGMNYLKECENMKAISSLNTAACYTSKPEVYYLMSRAELQEQNTDAALGHLQLISWMQPHHIRPLLFLMRIEAGRGETVKAIKYAKKIISMPLKADSEDARRYKREAVSLVCSLKKTN